jgi:threonine dehydrogenase-like Zn-dependent dehydrogenase
MPQVVLNRSLCCFTQDNTNPSKEEEVLYGHRQSGFFGYTHLTGGWDGGQAEYVRVPFGKLSRLAGRPIAHVQSKGFRL